MTVDAPESAIPSFAMVGAIVDQDGGRGQIECDGVPERQAVLSLVGFVLGAIEFDDHAINVAQKMRRQTVMATINRKEDPALAPVHPGVILVEEFLAPYNLTPYAAAARMHVPRTRIERLSRREAPVTVDTARRLGRLFGTTARFWLNLQLSYDLDMAETKSLEPIEQVTRAA